MSIPIEQDDPYPDLANIFRRPEEKKSGTTKMDIEKASAEWLIKYQKTLDMSQLHEIWEQTELLQERKSMLITREMMESP